MADIPRASAIRGKTIRFAWTHGPTEGSVHEHVFHPDGTVEWHDAKPGDPPKGSSAKAATERRPASGFTLTVVLDFGSAQIVGFASGQGQWVPVRGTVEVVS